jgi:Cysteine-rich CPCC
MVTRLHEAAQKSHRCPCCKFKTLRGRGQDEICPVCFWHDDGQDESEADEVRGGPNGKLSLRQAQKNFAAIGAVEERFRQFARRCGTSADAERLRIRSSLQRFMVNPLLNLVR